MENYYLIIVVFSCPHFSIYDISYTLENTRSFNERATHFKADIMPIEYLVTMKANKIFNVIAIYKFAKNYLESDMIMQSNVELYCAFSCYP